MERSGESIPSSAEERVETVGYAHGEMNELRQQFIERLGLAYEALARMRQSEARGEFEPADRVIVLDAVKSGLVSLRRNWDIAEEHGSPVQDKYVSYHLSQGGRTMIAIAALLDKYAEIKGA